MTDTLKNMWKEPVAWRGMVKKEENVQSGRPMPSF
jgi:hypothetical protein